MRAILAMIFAFLLPATAQAHELWFIDPHSDIMPARPELFTQPTALGVYLIAAAAIVFVLLVAFRKWYVESPLVKRFEKRFIFPFHARQILAALIGVDLVWNALGGSLFAPNLLLPQDIGGIIVMWVAVIVGMLMIFFEYFLFECSIVLFALFVYMSIGAGPSAMMQQLLFAGSALFLGATSPRTWFKKPISLAHRQRAYDVFRIFCGLNFLALAALKWMNPELDLKLIVDYPAMNFMSGLGMEPATFAFCVALVETIAALAIIFNLFVRPFAMVLVPMFTLSAFILGPKEVVGHLPIQAALAALILYGHTYMSKYRTHLEFHGATTQAFEKLPI